MNPRILLLLILATFFFRCTVTSDKLAGPSTELGNPVFIGLVLKSSLIPAKNAIVTVYKIIYSANSSLSIDTISAEFASLYTDSSGMFSLREISAGEYLIMSCTTDSLFSALKKVSIVSGVNSTIHDTLILNSPGVLRGVVSRGGQSSNSGNTQIGNGDIRVVLTEINQSLITGPDGVFSFTNVPEGIYSLAIYPDNNFFSEICKSIKVSSGSITVVDTVKLNRIPWVKPPKPEMLQIEYDTLGASVKLHWNSVQIDNLLGYVVERRLEESILDPVETFTKDTVFLESLVTYPKGTRIYYSIRSITVQFEESYPEGPVNIVIAQ
jgi:hypothetical protein